MAYTYKGKERDVQRTPDGEIIPEPMGNGCGTMPGYSRHKRRNEEVCDHCRLAWNDYLARRRGGNTTGRRNNDVRECGTSSGYTGHRRRGETPCRACADAYNAYQRKYRAAKRLGVAA